MWSPRIGVYLPWKKNQQGFVGRMIGGGRSVARIGINPALYHPTQNTNNGDPYCDGTFNQQLHRSHARLLAARFSATATLA